MFTDLLFLCIKCIAKWRDFLSSGHTHNDNPNEEQNITRTDPCALCAWCYLGMVTWKAFKQWLDTPRKAIQNIFCFELICVLLKTSNISFLTKKANILYLPVNMWVRGEARWEPGWGWRRRWTVEKHKNIYKVGMWFLSIKYNFTSVNGTHCFFSYVLANTQYLFPSIYPRNT